MNRRLFLQSAAASAAAIAITGCRHARPEASGDFPYRLDSIETMIANLSRFFVSALLAAL